MEIPPGKTTFKEVFTLDTLLIAVVLVAFAFLFIQNRMLMNHLGDDAPSLRKKFRQWRESRAATSTEATADEDTPSRTQRVRSRARQGAKDGRDRAASAARATREKTSGKAILVGLVVVGLIALNGLQFVQYQGLTERLDETNARLEAALNGDVDEDDLPGEPADVELLKQLEEQNEQLEGQNDDLQERLDELNRRIDELDSGDSTQEVTTVSHASEQQELSGPNAGAGSEMLGVVNDYMLSMGWQQDNLLYDNFIDNPSERGNTSFSEGVVDTRQELRSFLNSNTVQAEAARESLRSHLSEEEYQRALRGEGYVLVQVTEAGQYEGNSYFTADGAQHYTTPREVEAGDQLWVFVDRNGNVQEWANIRADCGNVEATRFVPQPEKPEQPKQPEQPEQPKQPEKPEQPDEKKCTDKVTSADGLCGTPNSGGEQQPVQDNDPEHVAPTDGYTPGDAEDNAQSQDDARECIDSGECDPLDPTEDGVEVPDSEDGGKAPGGGVDAPSDNEDVDQPDNAGDPNPEHDGSEETQNPDEGTGDTEDSNAQTPDTGEDADNDGDGDGDNNDGDPGSDLDLPNVD